MKKEELQKIIDQLESINSTDEAYFGIFQYGGGPDQSFIRANKQGLELFASQILMASRDTDEILANKEEDIIPIDFEENWIYGDTFVQYVEPCAEKRENVNREFKANTWQNKLNQIGCFIVLIIAAIVVITGIVTVGKWVF